VRNDLRNWQVWAFCVKATVLVLVTQSLSRSLAQPPLAAPTSDRGAPLTVSAGPGGKLRYETDEYGNRVCDFSYAGYKGGGVAIPDVPVAVRLKPSGGDDTKSIQAAVDRVGAMPLDENGFRGAVLLKRGKYLTSDTIQLRHSGVVIRGEGAGFAGTWIYHRPVQPISNRTPSSYIHYPQPAKGMIPTFLTHGGGVETQKIASVLDDLVPAGAERLRLDAVAGLAAGDEIVVICRQTQKWVDALGLEEHWRPFSLRFPRSVEEVCHDTAEIVLNVPVTSRIDQAGGYATAEVHAVNEDSRLRNVGLEDILFLSSYDRSIRGKGDYFTDEHHPNYVFRFSGARDGWMRRCVAFFYSCGIVSTGRSQHLTIEDCAMLDGVSLDTPVSHKGTRKYYFNANGDHILMQRCYARYARHAFVGNGPFGGAVFLDCYSEKDHLPSEWHQRWGHGHLFDNLFTQAPASAIGFDDYPHGQRAAFSVWWNCFIDNRRTWEDDVRVNAQPPLCQNYMIGIVHQGSGKVGFRHENSVGKPGVVESLGQYVEPRSLYLAQLAERLGEDAMRAVATRTQIRGRRNDTWDRLSDSFSSFPEWADPDEAPWQGWEEWIAKFEPTGGAEGLDRAPLD
jgi:hypothetical protein